MIKSLVPFIPMNEETIINNICTMNMCGRKIDKMPEFGIRDEGMYPIIKKEEAEMVLRTMEIELRKPGRLVEVISTMEERRKSWGE